MPTRVAALPHREAARLAVPAIASNVAVPLAGLVDTAMLGHFAEAVDVGAVGLGAAVIATIFWLFSFLRVGTTSLVGRAIGSGRREDAAGHVQRGFAFAAVIAGGWVAAQWFVVPALLGVLAPAGQARDAALDYTLIRGLSLPAVLVTLVVAGFFIGAKDTRTPLAIAVAVSAANVGFDFLFVGALGLGSSGAAWGTFGAEWIGAALAVALLWRHLGPAERARLRDLRNEGLRAGWGALARFNGTLMARTAILMSVLVFVASIGSRFGPEVLAANAILLQFMYVSSYALDGYANAAEAMVAHAAGARDPAQLHAAALAAGAAMAMIAASLSVALWFGRVPIVSALTDLPEVQAETLTFMHFAAALPIVSAAAWFFDGVYLGAGRPGLMLISMFASAAGVFVPVLISGAASPGGLGNHHVWWAFLGLNVARAVTLGAMYPLLARGLARVSG